MSIKEIFKHLEDLGINYAVLRKFSNSLLKSGGDIDILIENKNMFMKVVKELKLEMHSNYGPYASCRKDSIMLDFRIGYLPYQGLFFGKADKILKRKIREKYFFKLGKEDEFIHLILHSIIDKENFRKHKQRIEEISKEINIDITLRIMRVKLKGLEKKIIRMALKKDYESLLKLRKKIMMKLLNSRCLIYFLRIKIMKFLFPKLEDIRRFIEKLSWFPYKIINIKEKKKIILNLKKIGIQKKFRIILLEGDEGLSRQLSSFGFREPLNWRRYYEFIEDKDIVLDIGANIGIFTLLSEKAKRIISVEPLDKCVRILKKNIENNSLSKKVKIIKSAVGNKEYIFIKLEKQVNQSKIVDKKEENNTIKIKSKTLKELSMRYKPTVIRMDLEGYEYEILYKKIPKRIKKISLEFHTKILGKNKVKRILDYFYREGFFVETLIEDLPIRFYPFYDFLKKTGLIKRFSYSKENPSKEEVFKSIFNGRAQKFLFLKRLN